MNEHKEIIMYTDGACIGNPGPGGYGIVVVTGGRRREYWAGYRHTTNNRMELLAAIVGLETIGEEGAQVTLYSDSRYVCDAMEKGWARRWRENGWKRNQREKALNPDLWERLLQLSERHRVTFRWVRGHAGDVENERCDSLSNRAARLEATEIDRGYEEMEQRRRSPSR